MDLAEVLETRYILIVCNKHNDQLWGAAFGFNTFLPPRVLAESCSEVSGDVGDGAPQINQSTGRPCHLSFLYLIHAWSEFLSCLPCRWWMSHLRATCREVKPACLETAARAGKICQKRTKYEMRTKYKMSVEIPGLWARQEAAASSGLSRAIPEPLGYCAAAGQAAFTQVSWVWDVCKSAGSQIWEKWMDVSVPYPSKDFVTAPSPLKKKNASLTGYLLWNWRFFPLLHGGVMCVQGGRIWQDGICSLVLRCCSSSLGSDLASVLTRPGRAAGNVSCASQPREQNIPGSAAHTACPAFILSKMAFLGGRLISLFGYSCVSAAA